MVSRVLAGVGLCGPGDADLYRLAQCAAKLSLPPCMGLHYQIWVLFHSSAPVSVLFLI